MVFFNILNFVVYFSIIKNQHVDDEFKVANFINSYINNSINIILLILLFTNCYY